MMMEERGKGRMEGNEGGNWEDDVEEEGWKEEYEGGRVGEGRWESGRR